MASDVRQSTSRGEQRQTKVVNTSKTQEAQAEMGVGRTVTSHV